MTDEEARQARLEDKMAQIKDIAAWSGEIQVLNDQRVQHGLPKLQWHPFLDQAVYIRTVTMDYLGRLVEVTAEAYYLDDAVWVGDTGCRMGQFLAQGPDSNSEFEVYPSRVEVPRYHTDMTLWLHPLPRESQ